MRRPGVYRGLGPCREEQTADGLALSIGGHVHASKEHVEQLRAMIEKWFQLADDRMKTIKVPCRPHLDSTPAPMS
jgi:hypothetical protein